MAHAVYSNTNIYLVAECRHPEYTEGVESGELQSALSGKSKKSGLAEENRNIRSKRMD